MSIVNVWAIFKQEKENQIVQKKSRQKLYAIFKFWFVNLICLELETHKSKHLISISTIGTFNLGIYKKLLCVYYSSDQSSL